MAVRLLRPWNGQAVNTIYARGYTPGWNAGESVLRSTGNADDFVEQASDFAAYDKYRQGERLIAGGLPAGAASIGLPSQYVTPTSLSKWRKARGQVRAGLGSARVACVGDSKTRGAGPGTGAQLLNGAQPFAYPTRLSRLLATAGFNVRDNSTFGYGGTPSAAALILYDTRISGMTSWVGGTSSLGGTIPASANTNPFTFTPSSAVDAIDIYTRINGSDGSYIVDRGAGTIQTVTPPTSPLGILKTTVALGSAASTAVNITRNAGGSIGLVGVSLYDSTKRAVEVVNFGVYGVVTNYQAESLTSANAPVLALQTYAPDLTIIKLGTNDINTATNTPLGSVTGQLQAIITAAQVSGDVILFWPSIGVTASYGSSSARAAWRDAYLALAKANDCAFVDEETALGGSALAAANGAFADGVHEVGWAYDEEASTLVAMMLA